MMPSTLFKRGSTAVRAVLTKPFQIETPTAKPKSAAEIAKKWIGICDGGPSDLSTNPKYMEDFGK